MFAMSRKSLATLVTVLLWVDQRWSVGRLVLGETFGYLLTAAWTLLLTSWMILASRPQTTCKRPLPAPIPPGLSKLKHCPMMKGQEMQKKKLKNLV